MDLRLAPTALGCWAAALTTLHLGWRAGLALLGLALMAAGVVSRVRPGWRWIALASVAGVLCGAAATVCAGCPLAPIRRWHGWSRSEAPCR